MNQKGTRRVVGVRELMVMTLLRAGDEQMAYGAGLIEQILRHTGDRISPGAMYTILARMEDRGLIYSTKEDSPEKIPGGKRRQIMGLTQEGIRVYEQHKRTLWKIMRLDRPKTQEGEGSQL